MEGFGRVDRGGVGRGENELGWGMVEWRGEGWRVPWGWIVLANASSRAGDGRACKAIWRLREVMGIIAHQFALTAAFLLASRDP